jgi:hypothetical protein
MSLRISSAVAEPPERLSLLVASPALAMDARRGRAVGK